ncbi:hypothetical protein ABG067_007029 [Albugo candida]
MYGLVHDVAGRWYLIEWDVARSLAVSVPILTEFDDEVQQATEEAVRCEMMQVPILYEGKVDKKGVARGYDKKPSVLSKDDALIDTSPYYMRAFGTKKDGSIAKRLY